MATAPAFFHFRPTRIRASSGSAKSNKPSSSSGGGVGGGNWWTPIFGWAPEPDYMRPPTNEEDKPSSVRSGRRFAPFTEEKARQLRMKTVEGSNFHDTMYHSAIASRLASDFVHIHDDDDDQ